MATTPLRVLAALIAGATAVAAYALPLKLNIVVAIGVAVLLCFWLEKQFGLDPTRTRTSAVTANAVDEMSRHHRLVDAGVSSSAWRW
jgi:predicted anti-sigma-YlaC factor YlaD